MEKGEVRRVMRVWLNPAADFCPGRPRLSIKRLIGWQSRTNCPELSWTWSQISTSHHQQLWIMDKNRRCVLPRANSISEILKKSIVASQRSAEAVVEKAFVV